MGASNWLRRIRSKRFLLILAVAALAIGFGAPNAWAWYHLRVGRAALERYHPEEARDHLTKCLEIWPNSMDAHLLSSRAARQASDFEEADRHLRACQRQIDGTNDRIVFEWALLQAAAGNVREVDQYLERRTDSDPGLSPLIWEALAEGYIRIYRIRDALALLDYWIGIEPDNLRALELRGLAYQNGKSAHKGALDFRRVVEMDPTRNETRWRLVLCLMDMGAYDEASPHLEHIAQRKRGDPDVDVRRARCYGMLGQRGRARELLDSVLRDHPDCGPALRTRGQFALADQQPGQAEFWLRKAVEVGPYDYQSNHLLFRSLQLQNKQTEAEEQLRLSEQIKDRSERMGELRSRKLSEQPLDPALHFEMGVLLMRDGHKDLAERWFLSALNLDDGYKPAHAALADYYQSQGDAQKAEEHRRLSK